MPAHDHACPTFVLFGPTTLAGAALIGAWYVQSDKLASVQNSERPSAAQVAHYAPPVGPMKAPS